MQPKVILVTPFSSVTLKSIHLCCVWSEPFTHEGFCNRMHRSFGKHPLTESWRSPHLLMPLLSSSTCPFRALCLSGSLLIFCKDYCCNVMATSFLYCVLKYSPNSRFPIPRLCPSFFCIIEECFVTEAASAASRGLRDQCHMHCKGFPFNSRAKKMLLTVRFNKINHFVLIFSSGNIMHF